MKPASPGWKHADLTPGLRQFGCRLPTYYNYGDNDLGVPTVTCLQVNQMAPWNQHLAPIYNAIYCKKMAPWKERIVFQPSIFRCYNVFVLERLAQNKLQEKWSSLIVNLMKFHTSLAHGPFVGAWIQANLSFSIYLPSMFVQKYLRILFVRHTRSFLKFASGVEVHYWSGWHKQNDSDQTFSFGAHPRNWKPSLSESSTSPRCQKDDGFDMNFLIFLATHMAYCSICWWGF